VKQVIIGIDIGTTAAKVVAFGVDDPGQHTVAREYPLLRPHPGWEVQKPQVVIDAMLDALAECVGATAPAEVVAVSVSTAMHALIGLDADAEPLTDIATWADARARDEARALRATPQAAELHRRSGTPVHSMSPLVKLRWYAAHEPELTARAARWVGLKDLVLHALTGRLVTELSSAGGTGLLDLTTRTWDPDALALAGVRRDQMPDVLPTTERLELADDVARRVGLPPGTPVVAGAADGPLGNLGTGAMTPGVAGLSLGTSAALRLVTDAPFADPAGQLFCYALTDDLWIVGTPLSNGGAVARWAGDVFAAEASDTELLALAEPVAPGCDGLVMLPFLLAERGPLWNADLRGAFLGIRNHHTRGHFVRAAVEGVALQLRTILDGLAAVADVTAVRATGGVFRSPLWRDVVAAVLDRPLTVTGGAEGTALGAAALGLYAIGGADDPMTAVTALAPAAEPAPAIVAPAATVAVYREVRRSVTGLLDDLREAAALLAGADN
jgi:gluconokinase